MKKTLVVIASHENPDRLRYLLSDNGALRQAGIDCDFLVVDNGSVSEEYQRVLEELTQLPRTLIHTRENTGRETGAFRFASRTYRDYDRYMFLQDDTKVLKTPWLLPFQEKFDSTPECGAVGFVVYKEERHLHTTGDQANKILQTKFRNYIYDRFCGGAMLYTSREVLDRLETIGGIPCAETGDYDGYLYGFVTERLFSSFIQNLGYVIEECPEILLNGWTDGGKTR